MRERGLRIVASLTPALHQTAGAAGEHPVVGRKAEIGYAV